MKKEHNGGLKMGGTESLTDTSFQYYLGKSPEIKVLDFLIENKRDSWNLTEIQNQGRIARSTLKIVIPKLLNLNLLRVDRKIGNSSLYSINEDNGIMQLIMFLTCVINKTELNKHVKKKNIISEQVFTDVMKNCEKCSDTAYAKILTKHLEQCVHYINAMHKEEDKTKTINPEQLKKIIQIER